MDTVQNMHSHFSRLASSYRQVRTTDVEPIVFIGETLKGLPEVKASDVGCGAGGYDSLLFQHLNNLHLTCIDINEYMLEQVSDYLTSHGITRFRTIKADANDIPLEDDSMDCILTFNAIHHFDFVNFMEKSNKVIKENGTIFIYTRLRSQNARTIWGQCFPSFSERETRLSELYEMEQWIQSLDSLRLEIAKPFKYKRNTTVEQLLEKVQTRHYSTFSLYEDDELDDALKIFQENIRRQFQDTNQIEWFDENILLVLKPK
jgi:ubiquinone/menaquinone biosynthesis C-methylase UbiE